ncbi:glycosyltransferase [Soonwooa sp.]|uniref:glycosyltransferase family 2 protein n=1 Tax=Soonwooa sp. TaxID=1938592 RepID=UPI0026356B4C|nr:glycosyltransferase [Soonwooa sp.]
MQAKVSVIVPVYNVEVYLEKCLNSLVSQTLSDLEIIVVNDGSKDNSQQIIDDFASRFPNKIKAFSKENGGLSDARNFGLKHCTGEYIGFVDSDDYVTPNMFEEMYDLSQKHQAEMVICNLQKVDQFGNVTQKLTQIPNMPEKIVLDEHFSVFSDLSYFACNKIFRADLFSNKNFKKGIHFEDIQLIPQLLLNCKTIAQTQHFHYQYLERTDSITKTHTLKGLDILNAVKDVEVAFKQSVFSARNIELKNFQILEGVYTFLAYLAFVKNDADYLQMRQDLSKFMQDRNIAKKEVLAYKRFGENYFSSLSISKRIYYLIQFFVPIRFHRLLLSKLAK